MSVKLKFVYTNIFTCKSVTIGEMPVSIFNWFCADKYFVKIFNYSQKRINLKITNYFRSMCVNHNSSSINFCSIFNIKQQKISLE